MSTLESVNRVASGPFDFCTSKWLSVRLALPIVICGIIAVGLQTTTAGGPKLAAADLAQQASLNPDEAGPVEPGPFALSSHGPSQGPGDARHQAAATMLLLLVATARSKRGGGEAQRQAAAAGLPVRQIADARRVR